MKRKYDYHVAIKEQLAINPWKKNQLEKNYW